MHNDAQNGQYRAEAESQVELQTETQRLPWARFAGPDCHAYEEECPVPNERVAVQLTAVDGLAGSDTPQQAAKAKERDDRVNDGNNEDEAVVEERHICFHVYEYL
jgi:hypothetical protein